jgi:hypothetical protein
MLVGNFAVLTRIHHEQQLYSLVVSEGNCILMLWNACLLRPGGSRSALCAIKVTSTIAISKFLRVIARFPFRSQAAVPTAQCDYPRFQQFAEIAGFRT